jgi:dTDP-glucose pyrophosphorylase/predicted transcriptional regulator
VKPSANPVLPLVAPTDSIRQAMTLIDTTAQGIALVVDADGRLTGTITDGDIRRAILAHLDVERPVATLLEAASTVGRQPITAPVSTSDAELLHLMTEHSIRQVPLLDEHGRVVDLALLNELVKHYELPLTAVVMAGGQGTRLRPLTDDVPKPMLPVGDRPLLEHIIARLRDAGIRRVNLATHYKSDVIAQHFGDGRDFGVEIDYTREEAPLGTVGSLRRLASDEPLLVINGDILTGVDFRAMLDFHNEHRADATVAVRQYEFQVPYGVVLAEGEQVVGVSEKPTMTWLINAGMVLLSPQVQRLIPEGEPHDMPDLIKSVLREGGRVVCFPVREYWLDIGRLDDYERAQRDFLCGALPDEP